MKKSKTALFVITGTWKLVTYQDEQGTESWEEYETTLGKHSDLSISMELTFTNNGTATMLFLGETGQVIWQNLGSNTYLITGETGDTMQMQLKNKKLVFYDATMDSTMTFAKIA